MEFPVPPDAPFTPPGALSVAPSPVGEGYVMLYSPWPGFVPAAELRAASTPAGPWSPPVRVMLPDCDRDSQASCYSANLQPDLSGGGRLAFGYYDRFISGPPQLGSYLLTSIGIDIGPE
jgi:hypothetical protein